MRRDGLTDHIHSFENTPRKEINGFVNRLQEVRDRRKQIKWESEGPPEQKKFPIALRKVEFNPYEENSIAAENVLLQGPPPPLIVITEKFHRRLQGERYTHRCKDGNTSPTQSNPEKTPKPKTNHRANQTACPPTTHISKRRLHSVETSVREAGDASGLTYSPTKNTKA